MKKISIVCIFVILNLSLNAQTISQTVRGTVMDKQSKVTLPGANVLLTHLDPVKGTSSDENGNFRFTDVPVGRISLVVTYLGYHEVVLNNLNLQAGKELVLNIYLEEMAQSIDEVRIVPNIDKTEPTNRMATVSARGFRWKKPNDMRVAETTRPRWPPTMPVLWALTIAKRYYYSR